VARPTAKRRARSGTCRRTGSTSAYAVAVADPHSGRCPAVQTSRTLLCNVLSAGDCKQSPRDGRKARAAFPADERGSQLGRWSNETCALKRLCWGWLLDSIGKVRELEGANPHTSFARLQDESLPPDLILGQRPPVGAISRTLRGNVLPGAARRAGENMLALLSDWIMRKKMPRTISMALRPEGSGAVGRDHEVVWRRNAQGPACHPHPAAICTATGSMPSARLTWQGRSGLFMV